MKKIEETKAKMNYLHITKEELIQQQQEDWMKIHTQIAYLNFQAMRCKRKRNLQEKEY